MIFINRLYPILKDVPMFISPGGLKGLEDEFIKDKLYKAYNTGSMQINSRFVMVARGVGEGGSLEDIKSNEVFTWGIKSMHASSNDFMLQELLSPQINNKQFLLRLIDQIKTSFMYYIDIKDRKQWKIKINEEQVTRLVQDLAGKVEDAAGEEDLKELKYIFCLYLHLLNYYDDTIYRSNKIFISGQSGLYRYEMAYKYALGRNCENKEFAILDYWIKKTEETFTHHLANMFYDLLSKYEIKWFNSFNKSLEYEILTKYVLLPHRLVGYYYYKDSKMKYYCINPHLIDEWIANPDFEIGTNLYINQDLSAVGDQLHFNIIYRLDQSLNYDVIKILYKHSG